MIEVMPEQPSNALQPILVTELGIVIEVKLVQPENACMSIVVTELGIVIEDKPVQPSNAQLPIEVTEFGIVVFLHPAIRRFVSVSIIALQLSLESYLAFPFDTIIDAKPSHLANASSPISVTELGIVIEVKPAQSENA